MPMIDITNANEVTKLIADINTQQNLDRKEHTYDAFRVKSGDLDHYVEKRLAQIFPKTYRWLSRVHVSVTKKVIGRIARSYQNPPARMLENDQETEDYNMLMRNVMANHKMQEFDCNFNLHKYSAIWVDLVDQENELFVLRPLQPFQFDRVVNPMTDETEIVIVSMPNDIIMEQIHGDSELSIIQDEYEDRDHLEYYAIWSKESHVIVKHDKKKDYVSILPAEGNEDMVNPLGMLPFVFLQEGDETAVPSRNSLHLSDIELNSGRSILLTGSNSQVFGRMVVTFPESQPFPDVLEDSLFTYIKLPQVEGDAPATDAKFINANPDLSSFKDILDEYERQILEEYNVSTQTAGNNKFTSGVDRFLSMQSEISVIEQNQESYTRVENMIYQIIKTYFESMGDFRFKSEELAVIFPKQQPVQSEKELIEIFKMKKEIGIVEDWELLTILDPNMPEEMAREKVDKVKEQKQEAMQMFMQQPVIEKDGNQEE